MKVDVKGLYRDPFVQECLAEMRRLLEATVLGNTISDAAENVSAFVEEHAQYWRSRNQPPGLDQIAAAMLYCGLLAAPKHGWRYPILEGE